jgi:hypothetical protein
LRVLPSVETANKIFYFEGFSLILGGYQPGMTEKKKQGWAFRKESSIFIFFEMPMDFLCSISASANTVFKKTKKKNKQVSSQCPMNAFNK